METKRGSDDFKEGGALHPACDVSVSSLTRV